jgi:endonuclease/exonuclease/phosphatase family metal-dependent hydrolase
VKVVTLNLRADANGWQERFPLVIDVLNQTDADVIALQEIRLRIDQHEQITTALNHGSHYTCHLCEDSYEPRILANALLSRLPIIEHDRIELVQGFRTAQRILLKVNGQEMYVVNTHLHHKPYRDEVIRLAQMQQLLEWLAATDKPFILVGDMNADPQSETIRMAKQQLRSAYEAIHGCEPTATFPTPLREAEALTPRTIDYIFCSPTLNVVTAAVIGNLSHRDNPLLYPSDHYGLYSEIVAP